MYGRSLRQSAHQSASRKPINTSLLQRLFPFSAALQTKYKIAGVMFKKTGYPDFSPFAKASVPVKGLNADYSHDADLANKVAGFVTTPKYYTWHHVEDALTMQLVPTDIHSFVRHTGGSAKLP